MLQILILADDLSGAADCGVACVGAGLETLVALKHTAEEPAADVLSIDSDTRSMSPEAAAFEVDRLTCLYATNSALLLFKKIDSTLRGNVGPELSAALTAVRSSRKQSQPCVAIMSPAFPAIGRTTKNGTQFVHGKPLHDLDIWRVQGMTGHAHIPDLLQPAGLRCVVIRLDVIRESQRALIEQMISAACNADVLVCDAETDDDLFAIASASMQLASRPLWVGSAGLAYQLPRAAGIAKSINASPIALPPVSGPILLVIGSLSINSLDQVRLLASSSNTVSICVPPEILLAGNKHSDWRIYAEQLKHAIQSGCDAVLSPETEPRIDLAQRPRIASALACMAASVSVDAGALVASGGETARAVFDEFGIARLRLLGELEKGIPISMTENWSRALPVITKAGDFGGTDALLKCCRFLHRDLTSPLESGKVHS